MKTTKKIILTEYLISEIQCEIKRQSKFFLNEHTLLEWYSILMEEIGEIAKSINERDITQTKTEIIHSISVLVQIFFHIGGKI